MQVINTKKGFTLIELMVVVSIIALLSSIVVAGLTDARGGAKNNVRNETARQYITAMGLYHGEYGHYPKNGLDNTMSVCLGSGYPNGICFVHLQHQQDNIVNTAISEFAPALPASLEKTISGTTEFWGISYKCIEQNCNNYSISWIVEGFGNSSNCFGGATKRQFLDSRIAICTYSTIIQTEI